MTRFLLLFLFCSQGGGDKNIPSSAHEITQNVNHTTYYPTSSEYPKGYEAPNAMFDEYAAYDDSDQNSSSLVLTTPHFEPCDYTRESLCWGDIYTLYINEYICFDKTSTCIEAEYQILCAGYKNLCGGVIKRQFVISPPFILKV